MHGLDVLIRLNDEACGMSAPRPPYQLRLHPRICALRREIDSLPVDTECHRWLRYALWRYADQLIDREEPPPEEGWSNFEALQQAALGDRAEAWLRAGLR